MRNVISIFTHDLKMLLRHFFATAVAIAITLLPSLYAWLNIYANWDPYGNTGNISIAVVSLDEGYMDTNGRRVNEGALVVEDLRSSSAIDWVILDDEEEAVEGVYSGRYYAAVVFDEDFTYKMYNMLTSWSGKPSITYYENAKKNAVATKITDTAVESLNRSISKEYVHATVEKLMRSANKLADDLEDTAPDGTLKGIITQAKVLMKACMVTAEAYNAASDVKDANSQPIDPSEVAALIDQNNADIAARRQQQSGTAQQSAPEPMQASVAQINMAVYGGVESSATAVESFKRNVEKGNGENAAADLRSSAEDMGALGDSLKAWGEGFTGTDETSLRTRATAEQLAENFYSMRRQMNTLSATAVSEANAVYAADASAVTPTPVPTQEPIANIYDEMDAIQQETNALMAVLTPTAEDLSKEMDNIINESASVMDNVQGLSEEADELRSVAGIAAASLEETIDYVKPLLRQMTDKLNEKLRQLDTLDGQAYLELLVELLGGDPQVYGEYFSQMVTTAVNQVYPISDYGSAMAPFYTVLAIWVGGVILAAILKTNAGTEGLTDPKPRQLFFGRYLLFFVMSQLQTATILAGDLLILQIQCLYPGLLFLTGFVTSFTFSLLIYALALSFGDVGKAIVVVIMVLQIAGSSGTFPIELLPTVYQKVYRFFPFPYAINAMRECICGLYGSDLLEQLLKLLIFAAAALGIGLLVRRPLIGLTHYMEERLEETELF